MKHAHLAAAAIGALLVAAPLQAQTDTTAMDTDGDGLFSLEELMAAFPDMSQETFTTADTNGDGQLDSAEFEQAQTDGVIPSATDG